MHEESTLPVRYQQVQLKLRGGVVGDGGEILDFKRRLHNCDLDIKRGDFVRKRLHIPRG